MSTNNTNTKIECSGCKRTQEVETSKLTKCDGYLCSLFACKQNSNFKIPKAKEGEICHLEINAAGKFSGWKIMKATTEESNKLKVAKILKERGFRVKHSYAE